MPRAALVAFARVTGSKRTPKKNLLVIVTDETVLEIPLGSPLAAYIRVPLSWYHSTTYSFFPDETHSQIRRVYTHPTQQHSKRHFCGFCGTPLSYWSESPYSEADYIHLTLGSLLREDLADLEDMGLIPEPGDSSSSSPEEEDEGDRGAAVPARSTALRESYGVPWFDGMVEGTRLGRMRRSQGIQRSQDGNVNIEWEIVEYTDGIGQGVGGSSAADEDVEMGSSTPGKRKLGEMDESEPGQARTG